MTEIKYRCTGDGPTEHVRISLHGHAGFCAGNDIVCSAISCLSCTLMAMLEDLQKDGTVASLAMEAVDGGVIADFLAIDMDRWNTVWSVIDKGYQLIEEEYPDYVERLY